MKIDYAPLMVTTTIQYDEEGLLVKLIYSDRPDLPRAKVPPEVIKALEESWKGKMELNGA